MNDNIKKLFLLTTVILLFIGLSTISATDSADNTTLSTDTNTQESIISTDYAASNDIDNNINTQYSVADKNIKKDGNTTVKKDDASYTNRINLNNENVEDYFEVLDTDAITLDTINDNTLIQFDEIIDGVNSWYFNTTASGITVTANSDIVFTDQQFLIESPNVTFKDISFEYTPDFEYTRAIDVQESGFTMENCNVIYDASVFEGDLNTILLIKGDNSIIKDSFFDCQIMSTGIDWNPMSTSEYSEMPTTVPIVILADYVNITGNTITINEKGSDGTDYPSFYGIYIGGYYINFTRNNISLTGSNGYVYTVYVKSTESKKFASNVTIADNNITGISQHNYTAGIYIDGSNYENITVINNTIHAVSSKDFKEGSMVLQDVVYAVVITDFAYTGGTYYEGEGNVKNNAIINNTIIAEGHQVYGFEQFGGDNTLLTGNNIVVEGSRAQAMGVIGYNTVIENNNLTAIGDSALGESSPDYIPPTTTGVQVLHGSQTTVTNNNITVTAARGVLIQDTDNIITNNNITVTGYEYTIETKSNATGNLIENNLLSTDTENGSKTINDAAGTNTIGNNNDSQKLIITNLYSDNVEGTLGEEIELFVTIENEDEEVYDYDGQSIILYANGEEIDSQEIETGSVLFVCDVPLSWYKNITLVVKYPGNNECAPAEATVDLTVNIPTSIQAEDNINAQPNSQLTSISVIDIMNNTVDAANIDVYQNDTFISALSDYTITGTGSYPIKLVFDGGVLSDGYTYLSSEKEVTIIVNETKPTVNISLDLEDQYDLGDTIEIITGVEDEDENVIVGLNVDLYCNDEYVTTLVSDEDGWIIYDYTPTAVGNYTFTLKVNDDNYAPTEATKTVTVNKKIIPVFIMIELDDEYELGDAVIIMANVVDDDYENVAGVNVDLYIDDEFIASVESDEDGMVSYEYTPTAAGNYNITLKVNDEDYTGEDESTELVVVIIPKETFITLADLPQEVYVGDNISISGQVTDEDENAVENVNVQVSFGNQTYSIITDEEGYFARDVQANNEGTFVITAAFTGNDILLPSMINATVTVNKKIIPVFVNVDELGAEYELGSAVEVIATVQDVDNNFVSGVTVDLYIGNELISSAVSDDEGKLSYEYIPSVVGNYTLILRVNSENYTGEDYNANFSVYKKIIPVSVLIELDDEYQLGDAVSIMANVVDDVYENVAGVNVDLYIDDEFIASVESDEDGMVSYEYTPTAAGNYNITLKVNDEDYTGLDANALLTVNKIPTTTTVAVLNNKYGNVTISVTVVDENDGDITQGYIIVTDSQGNILASANVTTSNLTLNIPTETIGQLEVAVTYQENDMYQESNDETVIEVSKLSSYLTITALPEEAYVGENIIISGQLHDEYGNNIENSTVQIEINNQTIEAKVNDGQFSISMEANNAETYLATATFNGNDILLPAMNQTAFTINKIPTKTTVEVINNTLGNIIISVTVTDNNGQVITKGNVTVNTTSYNKTVPIESENTTIQLDITTKTNVTGIVTYVENDNYLASNETLNITVIIPTTIETADTINALANEEVKLNASVIDITNTTIDSAVINVYENNTFISDLSSYTFTPTASGNYTIKLVFDGGLLSDGLTYISSEKEVTINVNKRQATITVEAEDTIENTPTTVTVQVTDLTDENLPVIGTVEFMDEEGNILAVGNVDNSTATAQITFNTTGEHTITAVFNNTNVYETVNATTTITVNKKIIPVILYLDVDEEYELGSDVQVIVTIEDEDEKTVAGVNVDLYRDDELDTSLVSDEEGWITYTFTPESEGNYTITVKVNDEDYIGEDASVEFAVIDPIIPVTIVSDIADEIKLGENINITATVVDNNNLSVSDVNVDIYCNDELITSTVSDLEGKIFYQYTPEATGNYTITFKVNNDKYTANDTTATFTVTQPDKEYSLQLVTKEFTIGETTNIQANIYYGNEDEQEIAENITKGKVAFKVNGKTLKDENGKVIYAKIVNGTAIIYNYTIPESWNVENVTIEAVYLGSTQCESLKTDKELMNISKPKPKITTQDINTTVGSTITLTATVVDGDKTINKGKVVFKVNGKTLKDENGKIIYVQVTNNTASLEYTLPSSYKAKNYILTAVFTSSEYERMEDSKTLIITND